MLSLELDEAMANRRDRGDTFMSFLRDYLFDTTISDAEYVDQLHVRRAALAAAADHLLAVLDRRRTTVIQNVGALSDDQIKTVTRIGIQLDQQSRAKHLQLRADELHAHEQPLSDASIENSLRADRLPF